MIDKETLDKVGKDIVRSIIEKKEQKRAFYHSPLKKRIVSDILRVGEGFDSERLAYFSKEVKAIFGWEDISNEDLNLFLEVMSSDELEDNAPITYHDSPFFSFTIQRDGLSIYLISGQGTIISVEPAYI